MAQERVQRRLAAILATDVVGYSRLMEADEESTLARMKTLRTDVIDPKMTEYGGRIFKTTGDGVLAEFPSAVDAVRLAVDVQRAMARLNADVPEDGRIAFRIGISLGDVMVDGDDLYGNGVNVAARMEGLAETGGICVSGNVQEHIGNTRDIALEDMGEQSVKNIDRPVHAYRIDLDPKKSAVPKTAEIDAVLSRPAVAVLPFENLSGDPEQEYFADGLTEDIITALSHWRTFPVIARNSTFSYKGQAPDIREVGTALGARYVVEGSVRKAGNRVRVTAQLINAETGHHVWAEKFDRDLSDIFALQDEITQQIASIVEPTIHRDERQRVTSKPPGNLAAWEYGLRGYAYIYEHSKESNDMARDMFHRALELDPNYVRAYTGLAFCYANAVRYYWASDREEQIRLLFEAARRAVALDETDAEARISLVRGYILISQPEAAIAEATIAVQLNPHSAATANFMGNSLALAAGRYEEGIPWYEKCLRLNPNDPRQQVFTTQLALSCLGAERYDEAINYAQDAIRRRNDFAEARVALASALGHVGNVEMARDSVADIGFDLVDFVENHFYVRDLKDRLIGGLKKAGLTA